MRCLFPMLYKNVHSHAVLNANVLSGLAKMSTFHTGPIRTGQMNSTDKVRLLQCQDNMTEKDIGTCCRDVMISIPTGQHSKAARRAYCQTSVSSRHDLTLMLLGLKPHFAKHIHGLSHMHPPNRSQRAPRWDPGEHSTRVPMCTARCRPV